MTCINDHGGNGNATHDRAGALWALQETPPGKDLDYFTVWLAYKF